MDTREKIVKIRRRASGLERRAAGVGLGREVVVGMEHKGIFWEMLHTSSWKYLITHCNVGMRGM